jgi:universal stress protein A
MTYDKIIVAVENDEMDEKLCSRAMHLSELFGSKIKLVHVIEPMSPLMTAGIGGIVPVAVDSGEQTNAVDEHAKVIKSVEQSLTNLAASMINPSVTTLVVEAADIRGAIQTEAKARSADLIIVGSWGRSGLALLLGGATANNMLKDSPCDVLAVSIN